MTNIKRSPTYMKLKRCIKSCETYQQLECLRDPVLIYHRRNNDGAELMADYLEAEYELKHEQPKTLTDEQNN